MFGFAYEETGKLSYNKQVQKIVWNTKKNPLCKITNQKDNKTCTGINMEFTSHKSGCCKKLT